MLRLASLVQLTLRLASLVQRPRHRSRAACECLARCRCSRGRRTLGGRKGGAPHGRSFDGGPCCVLLEVKGATLAFFQIG